MTDIDVSFKWVGLPFTKLPKPLPKPILNFLEMVRYIFKKKLLFIIVEMYLREVYQCIHQEIVPPLEKILKLFIKLR